MSKEEAMPWYNEFFDEDYMRFHLRGAISGMGSASLRTPKLLLC